MRTPNRTTSTTGETIRPSSAWYGNARRCTFGGMGSLSAGRTSRRHTRRLHRLLLRQTRLEHRRLDLLLHRGCDRRGPSHERRSGTSRTSRRIAPSTTCLRSRARKDGHSTVSFSPFHRDWQKRLGGPYILFDTDPTLTCLDLATPLHVAHFHRASRTHEQWRVEDPSVRSLEEALFIDRGIERRLRNTNPQSPYPHPKLALHRRSGPPLTDLRTARIEIARPHSRRNQATFR